MPSSRPRSCENRHARDPWAAESPHMADSSDVASGDDPNLTGLTGIKRIAETQYMLREILVSSLKKWVIPPDVQKVWGTDAPTYHDFWTATFNYRFFDMGTLVRLATAVETGLRSHYIGLCSPTQVPQRGVFQRLVEPTQLLRLYADCGHDLSMVPQWDRMRELMLHRHLYAHRSGLVDDDYINGLKTITGEDITPALISYGYPKEEVYWFRPLKGLDDFIESARAFFRALPIQ
jgi:hypothetical protein